MKRADGLKAKYELLNICFEKITPLVSQENMQLGQLLSQIHNGVEDVVYGIYKQVGKEGSSSLNELSRESRDIQGLVAQFESKFEQTEYEKKEMEKRFNKEKLDFINQIEALQEENKKYIDSMLSR